MSFLTADQVALQLESLPGWRTEGTRLTKTYTFDSFADAISFMVRASFFAQELEHYPIWQNDHNTVCIYIGELEQHAIQSRDVQLAKRLESASQ